MSKGNINYKYLRRRKSWFRRNLDIILVYTGIALAAIMVVLVILMKVFSFGFFADKVNNDNNQNIQEAPEPVKEIVWHEDKEPEADEVSYTPPEDARYPYYIRVNRAANCVTVYGIDENGEYLINKPVIYQIITELVNHFGGEQLSKIFISDIDTRIKKVMK